MAEKESILIVDDDESTCKSLSLIFKKKGYETDYAGTGQAAREKIKEKFYNLALLDIKLPDTEGIALIPFFKERQPDMAIIMVTAHASLETAVRAMNEGASSYITKPLNMDDVLSSIKEVFEKQRLVIENRRLLKEIQHELSVRKRAEEELKKHRDHLEEMVRERTTKLAQANFELQREIVERKRAEKQIKTSLEEKEILLKEIHQRVNDNMQIISNMLLLQERHIKDKSDLNIFRETWNRIRIMTMIYEKMSQSENLAKIDFAAYTRSLISDLFSHYEVDPEKIQLKKNITNVYLDIGTAIPCGLIINELVSNSLKYGFPGEATGEVTLDFSLQDNEYRLTIGDNGKGLPKYLDFRKAESLGLQLVRFLCKKLKGSIELDRNTGTLFKIVFKPDME
ncbi:MAG: response regulator [Candidatus Aminicenantes bacterium]|nr:response regulator [Candidatus Aminicenantes bacterium]